MRHFSPLRICKKLSVSLKWQKPSRGQKKRFATYLIEGFGVNKWKQQPPLFSGLSLQSLWFSPFCPHSYTHVCISTRTCTSTVSHTLTHFHRTQPYTLTYTYTNPNPITHTHLFYSFRLTSVGLYIPVQLWGDHWPINVCAPLGYWTFKNLNKQANKKQTNKTTPVIPKREKRNIFCFNLWSSGSSKPSGRRVINIWPRAGDGNVSRP